MLVKVMPQRYVQYPVAAKTRMESQSMSIARTTEQFIEQSIKIQPIEYDYSLVEYKDNRTKVTIVCKVHGKFKQSPDAHLNGHGCSSCRKQKDDSLGLTYKTIPDKNGVGRRAYLSPCLDCGVERWVQRSKVGLGRCRKCSHSHLSTPERNAKISRTLREKYKNDPSFKAKVAAARIVKSGAEHWNWKGGTTPLTQRTRTSKEASAWKLAVLHRDSYTCRTCGSKENLQAHHINSWASFPEERFILENGLTMCKKCHTLYHTYEREVRKNANRT